ncbi:diphosphomevalonate decarboxylase [Ligilactobacillus sp. WC1T17]|uniref:diphosphomevalonate decarboxylase n=1 Tax=Ligilactobacillus ruminis TaxID=1623 RepID=A0ABY1AAC2_9LACO|nr:diphosphomevalonate decarboxylase [Ligilactobacillus ruminis]
MKKTARAHTNIALVKYWGKKDTDLIIPMNGSISLTLDHFYTDTTVEFDPSLTADSFILDGQAKQDQKLVHFMNHVRKLANIKTFAHINSTNHVPTAAGLASSSSAYAALALAASSAAGLNLTAKDLSRLARKGSGSATRSIYGGFVEWIAGEDDLTSYAVPLEEHTSWKIAMIAIVLNSAQKKISSRAGMQTAQTSPYYPAWVKTANDDLKSMRQAIETRDFELLGTVAESSALKMHALNLSSKPHFSYFMPESIIAMQKVEELRTMGIPCYYTMDAGPNVKVICEEENIAAIIDHLSKVFGKDQLLVAHPGEGAKLITNEGIEAK